MDIFSAAALGAASGAAEPSNGTLIPAVERPENPESWLPSELSRLADGGEGEEAKADLPFLDDNQNRLCTEDAAAVDAEIDVDAYAKANAAQEQLHSTVMNLSKHAQEKELRRRKCDLGSERALAVARAVAGREQHIQFLHTKIASFNQKVAEREELAKRLESALHASRQQAHDLTTYCEVIKELVASLEIR